MDSKTIFGAVASSNDVDMADASALPGPVSATNSAAVAAAESLAVSGAFTLAKFAWAAPSSPSLAPSQPAPPSDEEDNEPDAGSVYSAKSVTSSLFCSLPSSPREPVPRSASVAVSFASYASYDEYDLRSEDFVTPPPPSPKRPVVSATPEPRPKPQPQSQPQAARVINLRFKVREWYDPPGTVAGADRGETRIGWLEGVCVNRSALLSAAAAAFSVSSSVGARLVVDSAAATTTQTDLSSSTAADAGVVSSLGLSGLSINYEQDRLLAVDLHAALAWLSANSSFRHQLASPAEEDESLAGPGDYPSFIATCQREIPLLKWLKKFRHVLVPASQLAAHVLVRPTGQPCLGHGYITPPKLPVEDMCRREEERWDKARMLGIWGVPASGLEDSDEIEKEVEVGIFCGTLVGGPSGLFEDEESVEDLVTIEIEGLRREEFRCLEQEARRVLEIVSMVDPSKRQRLSLGSGASRTGTADCFAVEAIKYVWVEGLDEQGRKEAKERLVRDGGEGWFPGLEWLWEWASVPKMRFVRRPGQFLV